MSDSDNKNDHSDQLSKDTFLTTRRSALLGMVGLASTSLVACAGADVAEKLADTNKSNTNCSNISISDYIEQFSQALPTPVPATEGLATVGSAKLWYRDTGGNGETIILVHPTNLSGHCWGYQEKGLSTAGYRVISYSRRDYLGSEKGSENDTNDAADDLFGLVDYLKLERFHLVSAAGGGAVAAGYASRFASDKRLASLVVACSLALFEKTPEGKIIINKKFKEFEGQPKYLLGLSTSYRDANPVGVQKWIDMNAEATGGTKLTIKNIQSFGANSSIADFRKIKVPTLYISGSADLFCTPILMSEYFRNTPGSQFEIMNGAGHTAFWESPKEFDNVVINFLRGV